MVKDAFRMAPDREMVKTRVKVRVKAIQKFLLNCTPGEGDGDEDDATEGNVPEEDEGEGNVPEEDDGQEDTGPMDDGGENADEGDYGEGDDGEGDNKEGDDGEEGSGDYDEGGDDEGEEDDDGQDEEEKEEPNPEVRLHKDCSAMLGLWLSSHNMLFFTGHRGVWRWRGGRRWGRL